MEAALFGIRRAGVVEKIEIVRDRLTGRVCGGLMIGGEGSVGRA
jgi:hypothetical protein